MVRRVRLNNTRQRPSTPGQLTPERIKEFCALILRGLPADGVCDYLGIPKGAYWTWIRKGELFLRGNREPQELELYGRFVEAFRKASAKYRLILLDELHSDGNPNWAKQMTILERRDRKTFGKHDPLGGSEAEYDPNEKFL